MASIDYIVILLYFLGLIFISWLMSRRITSSQDMFIAGRNSSWWLSGISTYMTIFSASTFVVWGGVAYRSALVPVVSFASSIMSWVLLGGMLLINTFPALLGFGIVLCASTTLFSFITLPVEINASQRALAWLSNAGITNAFTHDKAEDALRSAAYTYVVAALGSLATLLYYVMLYLGARSRD